MKTASVPLKNPRGIRNHNPGNIRRTAILWRGMATDQSPDPHFVVFSGPFWGLRALGRNIRTHYQKHGARTVRSLIGRHAPPNENNTEAYIQAVAEALNTHPDAELPLNDLMLATLMKAIVRHENGPGDWYSPELYTSAASAALI